MDNNFITENGQLKNQLLTADDFNLKYKQYLEENHLGLTLNNKRIIDFLDMMFKELIVIPGFKYFQIKEKFNQSRVYTNLHERIGTKIANVIELHLEKQINIILK